jgi:serine/threonine protein kinase
MPNDAFLYTIVHREYYESLDRYTPDNNAFLRPVSALLPAGWTTERSGLWHTCVPPGGPPPEQGWKIHVSATLANAGAVLTTAAGVLIRYEAAFKFACDRFLFYILNSKRWHRGGSGKFITIYPRDEAVFKELLQALDRELTGYSGPYILSDRRYGEGSVLYYRYGGFRRMSELTIKGTSRTMIRTPDGQWLADERQPYYTPPSWTPDPFGPEPEPAPEAGRLKGGRYKIETVLAFSNSGGVYLATDAEEGQRVVIKEARPLTNLYLNGQDAIALLKKEHRLLSKLRETGIAPVPLDFFKEWEHYFLVQEYIDAVPLRGSSVDHNVVLRPRPTKADLERFCDYFKRTYSQIARMVQTLHRHNVVFTDLSHNNVLVRRSNGEPVLIDFEAAYERGIDEATPMFTPGFASEQQQQGAVAQFDDDLYALGALMIAAVTPMMAMSSLSPEIHERFLELLSREYGLPANIRQVIGGLMHPSPARRPKLPEVIELLSEEWHLGTPSPGSWEADSICRPSLVRRIVSHILANADYDRQDRLFPADPTVFNTNPLSVAYGACGVACALKEATGTVPEPVVSWILARECSPNLYPPGLYVGLSGIAWTLGMLGQRERARELAAAAHHHPLAMDAADVFYGLAGTGMSQLRMFLDTGDELYLTWARETAGRILSLRQEDENGSFWPYSREVYYGLAHGASGVALFLLYLFLVTNEEAFLEAGRRGLEYDLNKARRSRDGALTWTMGSNSRTVTPYWRHGGAGVGVVMLRYYAVTEEARYRALLDDIVLDAERKYTIFPGRFFGLAGAGDFLLDMDACFPEDGSYREGARKVASGVTLFRVDRPTGTAFPGEDLLRLSCDYGTGSAGICLFFQRLLHAGKSPYMLDELLAHTLARGLSAEPARLPAVAIG